MKKEGNPSGESQKLVQVPKWKEKKKKLSFDIFMTIQHIFPSRHSNSYYSQLQFSSFFTIKCPLLSWTVTTFLVTELNLNCIFGLWARHLLRSQFLITMCHISLDESQYKQTQVQEVKRTLQYVKSGGMLTLLQKANRSRWSGSIW